MNKPNWTNLLDHKCPTCSSKLATEGLLTITYHCSAPSCDFKIGYEKYEELFAKLSKTGKRPGNKFEGNDSLLNNLNHEEVAEDFSDSYALDI